MQYFSAEKQGRGEHLCLIPAKREMETSTSLFADLFPLGSSSWCSLSAPSAFCFTPDSLLLLPNKIRERKTSCDVTQPSDHPLRPGRS